MQEAQRLTETYRASENLKRQTELDPTILNNKTCIYRSPGFAFTFQGLGVGDSTLVGNATKDTLNKGLGSYYQGSFSLPLLPSNLGIMVRDRRKGLLQDRKGAEMALVQTGVRVPDELFREVRILAIRKSMQLQELFAEALQDYLAKQSGE